MNEISMHTEMLLRELECELSGIKSLMRKAAREFQIRVPPIGASGWIAMLINCSKHCQRCPHSIVWRRYVRVLLKKPNQNGNKTRLIYKEKSTSVPRARFMPTGGRAHRSFHKIMTELNEHSKSMTNTIKSVRQYEREAAKRRALGKIAPTRNRDLSILKIALRLRGDNSPSLSDLRRALANFCEAFPVSPQKRLGF